MLARGRQEASWSRAWARCKLKRVVAWLRARCEDRSSGGCCDLSHTHGKQLLRVSLAEGRGDISGAEARRGKLVLQRVDVGYRKRNHAVEWRASRGASGQVG